MVARHSRKARCCSFFRTSHSVQKPIVVERELCGWLVLQNLLRDWFMRFWWPAASIPNAANVASSPRAMAPPSNATLSEDSKRSHRACPLRPPLQRIWASSGASCLRIARGNCRLPAGHDQPSTDHLQIAQTVLEVSALGPNHPSQASATACGAASRRDSTHESLSIRRSLHDQRGSLAWQPSLLRRTRQKGISVHTASLLLCGETLSPN